MEDFIGILEEHELLEESEGALVVNLEEEGMPPCLIRKSDGATIYATRDLTQLYIVKTLMGLIKRYMLLVQNKAYISINFSPY